MRKTAAAIKRKVEEGLQDQLDRGLPGDRVRGQVRGGPQGNLPPTGNTGSGYTPGDDSVTTGKLADDAVTFAKMQNIATDRLIGRDTASTGDPEALTVSGGVEFTGSGGIQRSALTGDVTAGAGSGSTTLAASGVTAATYGDSTHVPQIAVDAKGRITSASNVMISGGGSSLTIEEVDGSPTESAPTKLIFPNGTLSVSTHEVTYTPAGGGGGAPTTVKYLTTAADGTLSAEIVIPGLAGSPDIAGAAGAGTSEEYDSGTTGLTWSPSTPATVDSNTTILSHLYISPTDGTERFGTKAWAPSGAFDARCKMSLGVRATGNNADVGLIVGDSGLSNFALLQLNGNPSVPAYRIFAYSYAGGYTQRGSTWTIGGTEVYARITRDGSNNVAWWFSSDGKVWQLISTTSFSFTPAKLGYRVSANGTITYDVAVDWLRTDV